MSKQDTKQAPPVDVNGEVADIKSLLLAPADLPTKIVELDGIGPVTVRGLTRDETIQVAEHDRGGIAGTEARMLTIGMVDPAITYQQALEMIKSRVGGEIMELTEAISELSGFGEDTRKSAMSQFLG